MRNYLVLEFDGEMPDQIIELTEEQYAMLRDSQGSAFLAYKEIIAQQHGAISAHGPYDFETASEMAEGDDEPEPVYASEQARSWARGTWANWRLKILLLRMAFAKDRQPWDDPEVCELIRSHLGTYYGISHEDATVLIGALRDATHKAWRRS